MAHTEDEVDRTDQIAQQLIDSIDRSPLREISNKFLGYVESKSISLDSTSFNSCTSNLQRERTDLQITLNVIMEKERSRKMYTESLENQIFVLREEKREMEEKIRSINQLLVNTQNECDGLSVEVRQLNRQLQSLEKSSDTKNIWSQMTSASRELRRLEDEINEVRRERADAIATNAALMRNIESLNEVCEANSKRVRELEEEKFSVQKEYDEISVQLHESKLSLAKHANSETEYENKIAVLEQELSILKQMHSMNAEVPSCNGRLESNVFKPTVEVARYETEIGRLQDSLHQSEKIRKRLLNQLQEARGNIRVLVRCRPLNSSELKVVSQNRDTAGQPATNVCVSCRPESGEVSLVGEVRGAGQVYAFDQVLGMRSSQEDVFAEVSDLVQSALDGYHVCIFSYGQTGSGKTYTMTGGMSSSERGIIPRSMEQVIVKCDELRRCGWVAGCNISIVELYNEEWRDLLCAGGEGSSKIRIVNSNGVMHLQGATVAPVNVCGYEEGIARVHEILEEAGRARVTAKTDMNERSSRSHVVVMVDIIGHHAGAGMRLRGGLRLVDLAGSERLEKAGTGEDAARLKETVSINKSLNDLCVVFLALKEKAAYVPYRNSKLTMMLQASTTPLPARHACV